MGHRWHSSEHSVPFGSLGSPGTMGPSQCTQVVLIAGCSRVSISVLSSSVLVQKACKCAAEIAASTWLGAAEVLGQGNAFRVRGQCGAVLRQGGCSPVPEWLQSCTRVAAALCQGGCRALHVLGSRASLTLPERQLELPKPAQHPQGKPDREQQPKNSCPECSAERRGSEKGAGLQLSMEKPHSGMGQPSTRNLLGSRVLQCLHGHCQGLALP